ncbi:MAG: ribosome silencing factor [Burkholderiaceae bacterium]|jgi:ribosome-associated protein|nr:ribosome silencing factor [Burkholderiaceae bacterium]
MDIRKLQRAIVDGLEDVKAQDIVVLNTEHLSPLFERVIIASGTSNRQTKALASSVRESVKARGLPVLRTEGEDNGEWIIVDCGAAVAHIMQPAIREYYHLEEIWGGKPVRVKLGAQAGAGLPKASEEPQARSAASSSASSATPAKRAAPKVPASGARTPARTASAKKPAAKKPAAKTPAVKKGAAKPAPAKRPARTAGAKASPAKAPRRTPVAATVKVGAAPRRRSR